MRVEFPYFPKRRARIFHGRPAGEIPPQRPEMAGVTVRVVSVARIGGARLCVEFPDGTRTICSPDELEGYPKGKHEDKHKPGKLETARPGGQNLFTKVEDLHG